MSYFDFIYSIMPKDMLQNNKLKFHGVPMNRRVTKYRQGKRKGKKNG